MPARTLPVKKQSWFENNKGLISYWASVVKTLCLLVLPASLGVYILHYYGSDFVISLFAVFMLMYSAWALLMTVMLANAE